MSVGPHEIAIETMSQRVTVSIGERYRLVRLLGQGGMGAVYQAHDRLTHQTVALKLVPIDENPPRQEYGERDELTGTKTGTLHLNSEAAEAKQTTDATPLLSVPEQEATAERLAVQLARSSQIPPTTQKSTLNRQWARMALTQEFRTLASLRHPHIISVLDYGFVEQSQPFFTMELLDNAQNLGIAAKELPLAQQALLLVQLLRALSYLHRRGVLHRDLKPGNVMVLSGTQGLQVKLLDFGLALLRTKAQTKQQEILGTLAYMAPESLQDAPTTEAVDLFAFGVIAYELFTRQHPFYSRDNGQLIARILGSEPAWELLQDQPRLVSLLQRLLAKSPADRPSADEALAELSAAVGISVPKETVALRESTLQAARFVGREEPWARLRTALDAVRDASGGTWLLAGESGVGKSRLLEELRVYALVQGVSAASSQSVSEGGGVYGVWREILRALCLSTELDELHASVLKSILPDLEALLERAIPDAPALNPQATQLRLVNVVESLLLRQTAPLLLLLEDLHWADPESLALLGRLASSCRARPILIVASYRDDERPNLPQSFPGCSVLKLERLSAANITELCRSMLGDFGYTPELVAFLESETEGNVFFVIEVMRALAEEAGQLSLVGSHLLPKTVLTGGIQAIVQRRLARLPEEVHPLLRLAAVAGRQLDLAILGRFEAQLEPWLYMAADAAVLEVKDQSWRFAHDKIRESLLLALEPTERQRLHLALARAMENTYPGSAPHAAALAEHYQRGGSPAQAAFYLVEAGVHALSQGATEQAAALLRQALASECRALLPRAQAARAHNYLVQANMALGRAGSGIAAYEQLLAQVGVSLPAADFFSMAAEGGAMLARWLRRVPVVALLTEEERRVWNDVAYATRWACEAYVWVGQPNKSIVTGLRGNELANSLGDKGLQSFFLAVFSYLAGLVPLPRASLSLLERGNRSLAGISNSRAELDFGWVASARHMNAANWGLAKSQLDAAIARSRQVGDEYSLMSLLAFRLIMAFRQQDELVFEAAGPELYERARRSQSDQFRRPYPLYQGLKALRRGDVEIAWRLFSEAEGYVQKSQDVIGKVLVGGLIALCLLHQGETEAALVRARATMVLVESTRLSNEIVGEGLSAVTEVYLTLWEAGNAAERRQLARPLSRTLSTMRRCARIFPSSAPRALLWHGRYAWSQGAGWLARQLGEASQRSAHRLGMPFDEALAQKWLGHFAKTPPGAAAGLAGEIRGLLQLLVGGLR